MGLFEDALAGLRRMAKREGNASRLAEKLSVNQSTLQRWLTGTRKPNWGALSTVLDKAGAQIVFPDEDGLPTQPVQIADPLSQRVEVITRTLRESGVGELEILQAVRSMVDGEIAKAKATYQAREPGPSLATAAEQPAPYNTEKKDP